MSEIKTKDYTYNELRSVKLTREPDINLPDLKIFACLRPEDGGKYIVYLAEPAKHVVPGPCPDCGANHWYSDGFNKGRVVHDITREDLRVDIVIWPKRYKCKHCGTKVTVAMDGILRGKQATERLDKFIREYCLTFPLSYLVKYSGYTEGHIMQYAAEEADKLDEEREKNPMNAPRVLGIDEKHILNIARGVLVNIDTGELIDMLEDNLEDTMKEGIKKLVDWEKNVEVLTCDMNSSYLKWAPKFFPNATIVIDKFHVYQGVEKRITDVKGKCYHFRKDIIEQTPDAQERIYQRRLLKTIRNNGFLFNYSTETLARTSSLAVEVANIIDEFPEFQVLREIFVKFEKIYECETYEEAYKAWKEWLAVVPPTGDKKYKEWCERRGIPTGLFDKFNAYNKAPFKFYEPFILNYFRPGCRKTNATTEGVNSLIGRINTAGNGLTFRYLRAKSLYASLYQETVSYGIDSDSIEQLKGLSSFSLTYTPQAIKSSSSELPLHKLSLEAVLSNLDKGPRPIKALNVHEDNRAFIKMLAEEDDFGLEYNYQLADCSIFEYDPFFDDYMDEGIIGIKDGKFICESEDEGYNYFDNYDDTANNGIPDEEIPVVDKLPLDQIIQTVFQSECQEKYRNMSMEERNAANLKELFEEYEASHKN